MELYPFSEKPINTLDEIRKVGGNGKPAEEVEPESTDNGAPCENLGEKPGKNADNLRGRTERDTDCGKKILA